MVNSGTLNHAQEHILGHFRLLGEGGTKDTTFHQPTQNIFGARRERKPQLAG
jgi:hypothetical protein